MKCDVAHEINRAFGSLLCLGLFTNVTVPGRPSSDGESQPEPHARLPAEFGISYGQRGTSSSQNRPCPLGNGMFRAHAQYRGWTGINAGKADVTVQPRSKC